MKRSLMLGAAGVLALAACSTASEGTPSAATTRSASLTPAATTAPTPAATQAVAATTTASPESLRPQTLPEEGVLEPGRYRFDVGEYTCADPPTCSMGDRPARSLGLEITVPAGYATFGGFPLISVDSASGTGGPDGGAVVLGWSNSGVGLYSDPCRGPVFEVPDIAVEATVDDFVEAVMAHPALNVTGAEDAVLGGYQGRFFTLTAPDDVSGCDSWQPWDPGFYAQGLDNQWDVWVIDADGFRVIIVNETFPGTSDRVKSELRAMAESIRFLP